MTTRRISAFLLYTALISPLLATPDWENEAVFRINKEEPHAIKMPFPDAAGALKRPRMESPWCQSLNGKWKIHWVGHPDQRPLDFFKTTFDDASWKTIPVPANVELHGYGIPIYTNITYPFKKDPPRVMGEPAGDWTAKQDRNPVSSYRRTFDLPDDWRGRRTLITFNGVASAFYLWVNGEKVGYSQDSRTPAEFDITKLVKPTGNVVAVEVYRHSDGSYLEDQDFWRMSGIFRDVYLTSSPMLDLRDFELTGGLDADRAKGALAIKTWTTNHASKPQPFTVEAKLIDSDGKQIVTHKITGTAKPGEDAVGTAAADGLDIKPWTAETPNLYQVLLILKDSAGKPVAHYATRIGFRTSEIKNGQLLVNGQPILIKGVNRHDHHHITGQYITEAAMREDLDAMKRLNINAIRTSHYPNDPRFLELCDEYGFYVISEANIESHGMGSGGESLAKNPAWGPAHLDRVRNMVEAFKNHPSVIMWSMGNEAGDGVNFVECSKWLKSRDTTRPVHYEQAGMNNHADLFSPMYFRIGGLHGWCRNEERKPLEKQRPLIQCEYNHTMGNSSGGLHDYWELIKKERLLQGGFIWDWRDQGILTTKEISGKRVEYFAYGGDFGDRPNDGNFCCNGVMHADLRPNPHSVEVFHQYREIEVTACEATNGKLALTVKNWHFFRDLRDFSATWTILRNGKPMKTGKFSALSCAPQETFGLSVPVPAKDLSDKDEYHLNVEFSLARDTGWAKAGFVVARDQFQLPWGKRDTAAHQSKLAAKLDSNADGATISGKGFKATFDHKRGTLTSYQIVGREWLAGPLALNFWRPPNDNDRGNKMPQRCGVWRNAGPGATVTKVEAVMKDQAAVVTYELAVPAGKSTAKITYMVHGDGVIEVLTSLNAQGGPEIPRIGMQCQLVGGELNWSWFGRGLEENYRDRKAGYPVGIWNGSVSKLWFPYVEPQETANRTDIRWSTFSDSSGKGIKFEAMQDLLEMGAYPFLQSDLEGRLHPVDIPQRNLTTVHVGLGQMGVGGEDSWGARPLPKNEFPPNREYAFTFRIVPDVK